MAQSLVSIRELKSRLSHYLRLAAMRETGQAQWSGRKLGRRKPVAKLRGRGSVAQLIVGDRE